MSEIRDDPWSRSLGAFSDQAWRVRKSAVEAAAAMIRDATGTDALGEMISDLLRGVTHPSTPSVRAAALDVFGRTGPLALPFVLEAIEGAPEDHRPLVEVLGKVGTADELPLLLSMFETASDDENLRCSLVVAGGAVHSGEVTSLMLRALEDPSDVVVLHALENFREVGQCPPVSTCRRLLERSSLRRLCIELLRFDSSGEGLELAWPFIADGLPGIRGAAVRSCCALLEGESDPSGAEARVQGLGIDDEWRVRCESLLEHVDAEVARSAARLLVWSRSPAAFPSLVRALQRPPLRPVIRGIAAGGDDALIAALEQALYDCETTELNVGILELVGALESARVTGRLAEHVVSALEMDDEARQVAALDVLGRIGALDDIAQLAPFLDVAGGAGDAAAAALASVLLRGGARVIPASVVAQETWPLSGPRAQRLCQVAAGVASPDNVPSLVFLLGSGDTATRMAAAHALGSIRGDHEGAAALSFALADEESHVRAAACRSLGLLARPESLNSLMAATADPSSLVRAAAVQALVGLNNPVAGTRFKEIVMEDASPTVVVHAIEGLACASDEQTLGLLMSLCSSEDTEVIKAAARALQGFARSHRATAALIGLLGHERWDVRWSAAESLGARGDVTALGAVVQVLESERDPLVHRSLTQCVERLRPDGAAPEGEGDVG